MIKDRKAILVFLGPAIVGFSAFYLVPFVGGFYYCLLNNAVERNFVGLSNIVALFSNKAFLLALKNTCILTGMAVPLMIAVSFTIAFALISS